MLRILKTLLAIPVVVAALAALLVVLTLGYGAHPEALEELDA